jgi:hypothetical protein
MNSSYPSFISENANRSFPFVENTFADRVPNDCFIDLFFWSKFKVSQLPRFILAVNKEEGVDINIPPDYKQFLKDGFCNLFFILHKIPEQENDYNGVVCAYIPLNNINWPYEAKTSSFLQNSAKAYELRLLVGENILNIANQSPFYFYPSDEYVLQNTNGLLIEPSRVIYTGGTIIDEIRTISQDGQIKNNLNGNLKIVPGYNTAIYQENDTIIINSSPDIGIGAKYNQEKSDICTGVFSINGVSPDKKGNFKLTGSNGVLIFDLPEEHKIVIVIDPKTKVVKCPI